MRSRILTGAAVLVAAILGLSALGWWLLHHPYRGFEGEELIVEIPAGMSSREILDELGRQGVLVDARLARAYLVVVLGQPTLKAGEYRFRAAKTTPQVLDKLVRGEVVIRSVTLVEGLTLEETAAALAEAGFGDRQAFLTVMRDPAPIRDLDPEAQDLEGYLFPETYHFVRGTSEGTVVATMVREFRRHLDEAVELRWDNPQAEDVRSLVTLASIIEKEAKLPEERGKIAGVFSNRLARGIGLYADPTIVYVLKREGRWEGRLRRADLQIDSPYNTYRVLGLPPGPICSPGRASLLAAARPEPVPYLYFVARHDGSHVFARTLAEHNRNVERWQRR